MQSIRNIDVKGKRVLVRCDFNEPLDNSGALLDDFRIKKSLPTIQYLLEHSAKIILMSHLGDPGGKPVEHLTLKTVKETLEKLLEKKISYASDCIGLDARASVQALQDGEILLLENLRFHAQEEVNNAEFAHQLAMLGEIYVNDAFSVCHRAHASVVGVPQFLPSAMGFLLEQELEQLEKVRHNPLRPFIVIVGGVKVETKAAFIEKISHSADEVLVSGLIKKELQEKYPDILKNGNIIGPHENLDSMDISSETQEIFKQKIMNAKTVVWNGPVGKFEDKEHSAGTSAVAHAIIQSGAFSLVGGGETIEFLHQSGLMEEFSWVSTGGGAMLDYISGQELPGLKALL